MTFPDHGFAPESPCPVRTFPQEELFRRVVLKLLP